MQFEHGFVLTLVSILAPVSVCCTSDTVPAGLYPLITAAVETYPAETREILVLLPEPCL